MEYEKLIAARSVADMMDKDPVFAREVAPSFGRYQRKDWGELPPDDKDFNDQAIGAGECIIAAYQTSRWRIWIITEWDRSATTILFPNEY